MKKFLFMLSLFSLLVGATTQAQTSFTWNKEVKLGDDINDLNQLEDGGTYVICSRSYYSQDLLSLDASNFAEKGMVAAGSGSGLAVFTFHKQDGEGRFTIESTNCSGCYLQPIQEDACRWGKNPATFVISFCYVEPNRDNPNGVEGFKIRNATDEKYLSCVYNSNTFQSQFTSGNGKGETELFNIIKAEPTGDQTSCYYITKKLKHNDQITSENYEWVMDGEEVHNPYENQESSYYYQISLEGDNNIVSADNTEFVYSFQQTQDKPFKEGEEYALAFDEIYLPSAVLDGGWKVNTPKSWGDEFENLGYETYMGMRWKFEDSDLGVKLLNVRTNQYLQTDGNGVTLSHEGTVFYVKEDNGLYKLVPSVRTDYVLAPCVSIEKDGSVVENARLGLQKADDGNGVSARFSMEKMSDFYEEEIVNAALGQLEKIIRQKNEANTSDLTFDVSQYGEEWDNELHEQFNSVYSDKTFTNLESFYNKLCVSASPNAYRNYGLRNVATGKYITTESMLADAKGNWLNPDGQVTLSKTTQADVSKLWKFQTTGSGFQLMNLNAQAQATLCMNEDGSQLLLSKDGGANWNIRAAIAAYLTHDNSVFHIYQNGEMLGVDAAGNPCVTGEDETSERNLWQLAPLNASLEISEVGYATCAFPFNAEIPYGVTAYTVKSANDAWLQLEEIEWPNLIPANTGVILASKDGGSKSTSIIVASGEATPIEGNLLQGATLKRTGIVSESTYVMAKNSAGKAAFLLSELETVPANKAYILASDLPSNVKGSNALNLNFDNITSISNAPSINSTETEYYDLNGRRVMYPAHGIFITGTGEKVLIK